MQKGGASSEPSSPSVRLGSPVDILHFPEPSARALKSPPQIPASPFPPHVIPDLSTLVNVQSQDGLIPRLYHISTLVSHSNSLWLVSMRGHHVSTRGNFFLDPYDVDLLINVDSTMIMLARYMAIMRH